MILKNEHKLSNDQHLIWKRFMTTNLAMTNKNLNFKEFNISVFNVIVGRVGWKGEEECGLL